MTTAEDIRFDAPLYSLTEAARYLGVPNSTFASWAKGYVRRSRNRATVAGAPVLSLVPGKQATSIPFIGLAEGMVLAAIRKTGVPMQRIRPALLALQDEIGIDHALASRRLYADAAEVLYDFAEGQRTRRTRPVHLRRSRAPDRAPRSRPLRPGPASPACPITP